MLVSQQYRAWSVYMDVQAGLAVYWWQRLITFGSSWIRVNSLLWNIICMKFFVYLNVRVCVGIEKEPSEDSSWYCPKCVKPNKSKSKRGRKKKKV